MDNKLFLIIVIILVILVLKKDNKETFEVGPLSLDVLNNRCDKVSKNLEKVNSVMNQVCDDTSTEKRQRIVNDNRLTCRNFVDRAIFMNNNTNSWCEMAGKKPKIRDLTLISKFTGLGKLDYGDSKLKPYSGLEIASNFPF